MEGNKYYTPKIEEFHVGYEYEVFDKLHKEWLLENNFFNQQGIENYAYLVKDKELRVKYLDKEDIESLGWKQEFDMQAYILNSNSSGVQLYDEHDDSEGKGKYLTIYDEDVNTIFCGFIKNKSELKKLMKQLDI